MAKRARRFGFWIPFGIIICLGIAVLIFLTFAINIFITFVATSAVYFLIITNTLKGKFNIPGLSSRVIETFALFGLLEVIGFSIGIFAVSFLGPVYLVAAFFVSILLISWGFGADYDELKYNNNNSSNQSVEIINNIDNNEFDSNEPKEIKECPNCGNENAIDSKICIYCSNVFEKDDKK